jgi:hypothetical protein
LQCLTKWFTIEDVRKLDGVMARDFRSHPPGHPRRLVPGSARISYVAASLPMSLTGFCKHVRVLEKSGLVRRTRHGRENTLELNALPLREVAGWVLRYQHFWDARLDRLEKFFTTEKEK